MKNLVQVSIANNENDYRQCYNLVLELAKYEGEDVKQVIPLEKFLSFAVGEESKFKMVVAKDNEVVVGLALFYYRYSTWKGKQIHLEDFYIKKEYRGGLGGAMFQFLKDYAQNEEVEVMEWIVHDTNPQARKFYEKQGAYIVEGWDICRIEF